MFNRSVIFVKTNTVVDYWNTFYSLKTSLCLISSNQMGMEVLEGLRVSQSQQCPLSRKINKQINSHPATDSLSHQDQILKLEDPTRHYPQKAGQLPSYRCKFRARKAEQRTEWVESWEMDFLFEGNPSHIAILIGFAELGRIYTSWFFENLFVEVDCTDYLKNSIFNREKIITQRNFSLSFSVTLKWPFFCSAVKLESAFGFGGCVDSLFLFYCFRRDRIKCGLFLRWKNQPMELSHCCPCMLTSNSSPRIAMSVHVWPANPSFAEYHYLSQPSSLPPFVVDETADNFPFMIVDSGMLRSAVKWYGLYHF